VLRGLKFFVLIARAVEFKWDFDCTQIILSYGFDLHRSTNVIAIDSPVYKTL
jgi:hypothetical protein